MRSSFAIALLIVCTLLASSPPAAAQGQVITRITPEALATAMTQAGWKSQVEVENNEKYIKMTLGRLNAFIDVFDCTNQGCSFFSFVIVFAADARQTPAFANNFNGRIRFVRGYAVNDTRFVVQSDVDLTGGVTVRHLQEAGGNFASGIDEFLKMFN